VETGWEMKATVVILALVGSPAASLASTHIHASEPALMVLSGALLLGLASLLRRRSAAQL
jgi:hypothetical protein